MSADSRPSPEARLIEVETQLTHLQHFTEQLNQVITEQAQQLYFLQRKVVRQETQIRELREKPQLEDETDLLDEKPPHY